MEALKIIEYNSQLSDTEVVNRVLSGEKELFEILLRRYNQTLYRVIRSYLKDGEDVEDAMQEAYLKAYDKLQFQGNAALSTWLIRIGINEALQRIRAMKKTGPLYTNEDDLQSEKLLQIPDSTKMNPEKKLIQKEIRILIEQAIDQLPPKYRTIYMLREVEEMENEEIANCLNISDSNVKVRLHRAKNVLKDALFKLPADTEIFEFGNSKCDRLVNFVMNRI